MVRRLLEATTAYLTAEAIRGGEAPRNPLAGRIVAAADVVDALVHRRIYKDPWPIKTALEYMRNASGRSLTLDVLCRLEVMSACRSSFGRNRLSSDFSGAVLISAKGRCSSGLLLAFAV